MSDVICLGKNNIQFDLDEMFPVLPPGNIYVALSGGVESTILLYLLQEKYSRDRLIGCTVKYGDRRFWEFNNAKKIANIFRIKHVQAGFVAKSAILARQFSSTQEYFNRENLVFYNVRQDPLFVAGFTGKNTTTLDPEIITPDEQSKYLTWYGVHRPFLEMDKYKTTELYYKLNVDHLLGQTHSCQVYGNVHCGRCHGCSERIDAFDRLGKKDPAIYKEDYDTLVKVVRESFHVKWPRKKENL